MKPSIRRTKIINGVTIPAFIHNFSYHFHNLEIYEDGIIECWEHLDLGEFRENIETGRVTPTIPDGGELDIFHLGNFIIEETAWEHNKTSFYQKVDNCINELKTMEKKSLVGSLHPGKEKEQFKTAIISSNYFKEETVSGDQSFFFFKEKDIWYLTDVRVYADESIQLEFLPETRQITFADLDDYIRQDLISTTPPVGSRITIHGLGSFKLAIVNWTEDVMEKRKELTDMVAELNGKDTTSDICIQAYEDYLKNPSKELKRKLRMAYENVPEYLRRYLTRDMDAKDHPIRHIIYNKR